MDLDTQNRLDALEMSMREHQHNGIDSTSPLQKDRPVTLRVVSSATVSPTNLYDCVDITALAAGVTIATPTGTPFNFQKMIIRIKDNGTARAITWGAGYASGGETLPTITVISKLTTCGFIYNSNVSLWYLVALAQEA